jgi:hypothetical protein
MNLKLHARYLSPDEAGGGADVFSHDSGGDDAAVMAAELAYSTASSSKPTNRQSERPAAADPAKPVTPARPNESSDSEKTFSDADGREYVLYEGKRVYTDGESQGEQQPVAAPTAPTVPAAPPPMELPKDESQLKTLIQGIVQGLQPAAPAQPATQERVPTEAEQRAAMNYWEPTQDFYTKLNNPATQPAAIQEMRDGLVKEAVTASNYLVKMALHEVQKYIAPLQQFYGNEQQTRAKAQFFEKFPTLKGRDALLHQVAQAHAAANPNAPWEPDKIAAVAEQIIRMEKPEFTLVAPAAAPTQTQPTKTPQMSKPTGTSVGGQGGAGGKTASAKPKSVDGGLWD